LNNFIQPPQHSKRVNTFSYPSTCDVTTSLLSSNTYNTTLQSGVKYCYRIINSAFINGKPVDITMYRNNQKTGNGKGIFAIVGENSDDCLVMLESNVDQAVTIYHAIPIQTSVPTYFNTKNSLASFNLLKKNSKYDGYYMSCFLQFGPKMAVVLSGKSDQQSVGLIYPLPYSTSNFYEVNNGYTYRREYLTLPGVFIVAASSDKNGEFTVKFNSDGNEWVTPVSGFIKAKYGTVYSQSDFKEAEKSSLSTGAIVGIVIGSIIFIVLIILICCCCCCKKSAKVEQEEQQQGETNSYPQANYGQPQGAYVAQPQPVYAAQPVVAAQPVYAQQPVYAAQPAQPVVVAQPYPY